MSVKLKYGNTNTFFINGLLFDTDMPGTLNLFYKAIKQNGISIQDIKYVMCSHYHPDHMGLVSELMNLGIKLVVTENQIEYIHSSDEILKRQFGERFTPINEANALVLKPEEGKQFLEQLGIQGNIIFTQSHSQDGVALILNSGECFVGDIEPPQYIDAYADNKLLKRDWENIMSYSPKLIHFGHNIDLNL